MARPLDGLRQGALVLGAAAGLAARIDPGALADEAPQEARVLVVDARHLLDAHDAGPPPPEPAAPAGPLLPPRRASGPPGGAPPCARPRNSPRSATTSVR